MTIILLRHAPAEERDAERWPEDVARPLSETGRRKAARAGRGLARLVPSLGAVWTSPAARAAETAAIFTNLHPRRPPVREVSALLPHGRADRVLRAIASPHAPETLVLVGHEPDLGLLAARLLGAAAPAFALRKAGAARIDIDPDTRRGTLVWWVPPRILRRIA